MTDIDVTQGPVSTQGLLDSGLDRGVTFTWLGGVALKKGRCSGQGPEEIASMTQIHSGPP